MIGYLEGKILHRQGERIMILAGGVGYEVLLPSVVSASMTAGPGEEAGLYIYFHQTEKQPKPVLIGFNSLEEREFFERFISVEAIGPIKAVSALCIPIGEIAAAIENKDSGALRKLKGIGARTADKIIATLRGKMAVFAGEHGGEPAGPAPVEENFHLLVLDVLVNQLGHKAAEAKELINQAIKRNPAISSPEELFDEVYRGETG
ncbi:Holliday junction branch migration protein RuvA [Desulfatibacillum alkenivorans]|nr:Holliday junction branch migration protein RuvA [Desulfatibacillum alkenivorans]